MKYIFKIILWACLIELATSPLRAISFMLCTVVTFVLFFIFMNIVLKRYSAKLKSVYLFLCTLIGCSLMQVVARIYMADSLVSLPDFLFHLLGIVMGYLLYKSNKTFKAAILALSLLSCSFIYYKAYYLWLHKLNYGTFSGQIEMTDALKFQFVNEKEDTLSINDFEGKYVIADFWYTGCGVCFRKFPQIQALYNQYKDNPAVTVISINAKLKEESGNIAFETIAKRGYSFPVYRLDIDNPVLLKMGVDGYPTVLIFNNEGNMIFRGNIANADNYIKHIINSKEKCQHTKENSFYRLIQ